ncbi:hypothetical protein ANACOL_03788 [Anaerotruncus colihominis DSM 17241]|uniref:Uncharacterized protein n=1 Tax=Anaerotruncus colihominis DSM 17241 TaxID=445972 RepID=B0PG56_9FIRM|nr:hypothetical protein ANACOL_03788 [Anaerotruncus colihominis DSM 17241]
MEAAGADSAGAAGADDEAVELPPLHAVNAVANMADASNAAKILFISVFLLKIFVKACFGFSNAKF